MKTRPSTCTTATPGRCDQQAYQATWDEGGSPNFESIYHLHDDFADASANQVAGTNNGSTDSTGLVGDGQTFDGSSYIDTNWNSNYGASQDFTWSGWFKVTTVNGSDDIMGIEDRGAGDDSEIRLAVRDDQAPSGQADSLRHLDPARLRHLLHRSGSRSPIRTMATGITRRCSVTAALPASSSTACRSIAMSWERMRSTSRSRCSLGAQWQTDSSGQRNYFTGELDEIRTATVARSADWLATEYNNQSDPYAFYRILPPVQQADVELDITGNQITLEGVGAGRRPGIRSTDTWAGNPEQERMERRL